MSIQPGQLRRAVIYLRTATPRNNHSKDHIAKQRQACLERAAELGMTMVHEYADYGSGSVFKERSGLQAMLRDLKARGDTEYVIAYDHARVARNTQVYTQIIWAIEAAGARLEMAHASQAQQEFMELIQSTIADIASRQHGLDARNSDSQERS